MVIQSILIPKNKFTKREADDWIKSHGYKKSFHGKTVHITDNYYRYRQASPHLKKERVRTITLGNDIKIIEFY